MSYTAHDIIRMRHMINALARCADVHDYDLDLINMEIQFFENVPEEWEQQLRDQCVSLDDYDYAIVCDRSLTYQSDDREEYGNIYGPPLLRGCCENKWFYVELYGKELAIGMAYHG